MFEIIGILFAFCFLSVIIIMFTTYCEGEINDNLLPEDADEINIPLLVHIILGILTSLIIIIKVAL